LNFQIREAVNGEAALTMFQHWHPQLIFMDRRMPVLDGLSATRQIRALPDAGEAVIIAVSAHSFKGDRQEMLAAGCNDFLSKPFSGEELLNMLRKYLQHDLAFPAGDAWDAGSRTLSADDLQALSPSARHTLHRLALECDDAELAKWLEAQDGLSLAVKTALSALIRNYRFEKIQELSAPPA
jgi:two-component system sensor histidine kinase/response regulator